MFEKQSMSLLGGEVSDIQGDNMARSHRDVTWRIEGITCMKCVRLITEALLGFKGITEVLVSKELSTATARICQEFEASGSTLSDVVNSIQSLVNGKFKAAFFVHIDRRFCTRRVETLTCQF